MTMGNNGDGDTTPWGTMGTGTWKQGVTGTDKDDNREGMGLTMARGQGRGWEPPPPPPPSLQQHPKPWP